MKEYKKIREAFAHYWRLNIAGHAASLSFFTLVSLFPLCFFLVHILSAVFPYERAVGEIVGFIQNFLPYQSPLVTENLRTVFARRHTFSLFGAAILFGSAGMMYINLQHIIHDMLQTTRRASFFMTRLSFLVWMLGMVIVLLSPLVFSFIINIIGTTGLKLTLVGSLLNKGGVLIVGFLIFYLVIVSMHLRRLPFKRVLVGALLFAIAIQVGKMAFVKLTALNLVRYNLIYGSFASLMLGALWIFYFFNVFLFFVYWTTKIRD